MGKHKKPIMGVAAITVTMVLLTSGGAAYAYWTTTGSGTSRATVATIKPLEIKMDDVQVALNTATKIVGTLSNPNDFEVSLVGTHIFATASVDANHATCGEENFRVVAPTTKAMKLSAGASTVLDPGSITLIETTKDQTACQGASVTLHYMLK